jgi:pimeloyl-ACP methyl ester carboxylesterase
VTRGLVWRHVAPVLKEAGHTTYTPTLTGLGERARLANPNVRLDTHIADVMSVLEYEDLRDVTLVGHSYGVIRTFRLDRASASIRCGKEKPMRVKCDLFLNCAKVVTTKEYVSRLQTRRRRELELIEDDISNGWEREVERHRCAVGRIEQRLAGLGELIRLSEADDGTAREGLWSCLVSGTGSG